jgi:hypothetical protein
MTQQHITQNYLDRDSPFEYLTIRIRAGSRSVGIYPYKTQVGASYGLALVRLHYHHRYVAHARRNQ